MSSICLVKNTHSYLSKLVSSNEDIYEINDANVSFTLLSILLKI
jgi:hypothetical protein